MAKLYNRKSVATNVNASGAGGNVAFTYKGFDSRTLKNNYKLFDRDLVKQDLLNHFHIRKGEKLENPSFGTIIWDILFEPFTEDIKKLIADDVTAIINYDPRLRVNKLLIDSTDMGIRIEAELVYLPFNINERITLDFDRQNLQVN